MKALSILAICLVLLSNSCKTKSNNESSQSLDQLCSIKPNDWSCKLTDKSFDSIPMLKELEKPKAVVEFTKNDKSGQPVYFYIYDISKKSELEKIIQQSMVKASCVPVFLGQNNEIYVVISSCSVNSDFFAVNNISKPAFTKIFSKFDVSIIK